MFVIDSVLKTNHWKFKIKDLNLEIIIGSFYEKRVVVEYVINELLSRTRQSYKTCMRLVKLYY